MAANTNPIFVLTPKVSQVRISTANTNLDGTGTLNDVITGGTNGTLVHRVNIIATGTTTAGVIRFYIYDGTNNRFWDEVAVTAATPSATVRAFKARILSPDLQTSLLVLPSTYVLRCAPYNAETFDVSAFGGDY